MLGCLTPNEIDLAHVAPTELNCRNAWQAINIWLLWSHFLTLKTSSETPASDDEGRANLRTD
jgi:hypothetical protein